MIIKMWINNRIKIIYNKIMDIISSNNKTSWKWINLIILVMKQLLIRKMDKKWLKLLKILLLQFIKSQLLMPSSQMILKLILIN